MQLPNVWATWRYSGGSANLNLKGDGPDVTEIGLAIGSVLGKGVCGAGSGGGGVRGAGGKGDGSWSVGEVAA